eukprot:CAMPEP_0194028206 /NCGR_PEP_ID=MMETSP0009_2-20130614/2241_1 /TAXON_ID=210454 /ORGANISM="Grammatophora oceanica, Strain CCMP 410" /LENGTH=225 /DNA_ID=CAMNT_0038667533 /DNA_START=67 /DNA_END=744 /DNA_ORIENTATION=-
MTDTNVTNEPPPKTTTTTTTATDTEERMNDTSSSYSSSSLPRTCNHPVSLVDLFPTLIDLCDLPNSTLLTVESRPLDGHSLRPFLQQHNDSSSSSSWQGPNFALSALSQEYNSSDPIGMSLTTRYEQWRYIRYANGLEELYNTHKDPYEWNNLVVTTASHSSDDGESYISKGDVDLLLKQFRTEMFEFVKSGPPPLEEPPEGELVFFDNVLLMGDDDDDDDDVDA